MWIASPVEPSRTRPRTPFFARWMLCCVWVSTSIGAWREEEEEEEDLKKVGLGTKTPVGGTLAGIVDGGWWC